MERADLMLVLYSILALGLVALGVHVDKAILRVLQAIDATRTSPQS